MGVSPVDRARGGWVLLATLAALAALVPAGHLAVNEASALHVPAATVALIGRFACYALVAISLDLAWGCAGVASLGSGAFFALGGYAIGTHLARTSSMLGDGTETLAGVGEAAAAPGAQVVDVVVRAAADVPAWYGSVFDSPVLAAAIALCGPALLAFAVGAPLFRSRASGAHVAVVTLALSALLMFAFGRAELGFGGDAGLGGFRTLFDWPLQSGGTRVALCLASLAALALGYIVCRRIVVSGFGRVLAGVRADEARMRAIGFRTEHFKLWTFTTSAAIAAIAGALYVPQAGVVTPAAFDPLVSLELVLAVALGGRGMFWGAVLGALIVTAAKAWVAATMPEAWPAVLGGSLVLAMLFLPKGLIGLAARLAAAREETRHA